VSRGKVPETSRGQLAFLHHQDAPVLDDRYTRNRDSRSRPSTASPFHFIFYKQMCVLLFSVLMWGLSRNRT
jgi:hypothetical protein